MNHWHSKPTSEIIIISLLIYLPLKQGVVKTKILVLSEKLKKMIHAKNLKLSVLTTSISRF